MGYITLNELFEKINSVQEWTEEQKSKCKKYLMEHGLQEMYDKTDVELYAFKYNEAGEIDLEESIIFNGFNIEYSYKKDFTTGETVRRPMTANKYELYGMDLQRLVDLGYVDSIPREWLEPFYYAQVETVYKYELKSDILGNHSISLGRKGFAYSMKSDDVAVNVTWSLGVGLHTDVDAEWLNGLKEAIRYLAKPRPSLAYNVIYTVCSIIDDMLVVLLEDEVVEAINDYIEKTGARESSDNMHRNLKPFAIWKFTDKWATDWWESNELPTSYVEFDTHRSLFKLCDLWLLHWLDAYKYFKSHIPTDLESKYNIPENVIQCLDLQKEVIEQSAFELKNDIGTHEAVFIQNMLEVMNLIPKNPTSCDILPIFGNLDDFYFRVNGNVPTVTPSTTKRYPDYLDDSEGNSPLMIFTVQAYYKYGVVNYGNGVQLSEALNRDLLTYHRPNDPRSYTGYNDYYGIYTSVTYTSGNYNVLNLKQLPEHYFSGDYNVVKNAISNTFYIIIYRTHYKITIPNEFGRYTTFTPNNYWSTVMFQQNIYNYFNVVLRNVDSYILSTDVSSFTQADGTTTIDGTFPRALVDLPEVPIEPTIFRPVNPEPIEPDSDPTIPSPLEDPEDNQPDEGDPPMQDDGQTPDIPEMLEGVGFNIFRPSENNLKSLIAKLWSNDFKDKFNAAINNPIDSIISLHILYALPQTGEHKNIYLGNYDTGISSAPVTQRYKTINCGSITISEYFQDLRDYVPFTTVELFIPFTGMVKLDTNTVMGSTIVLTIRVDSFTGSTLAEVRVIKGSMSAVLYTFEGNCAVSIPLTGAIYNNFMSGVFGVVGGIADVVGGVATAHPLNAISGGVNAVESAISSFENHSSRSGSFTSNALAMTSRIPYLVIDRTRAYDTEYSEFMGYATNKRVRVGSVSGYLRAHDVKVDIPTATDEEKEMIKALLEEGIYV